MSSSVPTVVVTGAGGFVGTELVKQLLSEGYTVRATVRKIGSPQYAHLEKLASVLPGKLDYFESDLTEPGSFDKPIEGATYVFHTASPIDMGTDDNERDEREVLQPAVTGTSTVIKAASKHKSVKRVVITSSIAAIMTSKDMYPKEGEVYTDKTFNTFDTVDTSAYQASKSAAEREAWQLAEDLKVDIVTIHPSLVVGPLTSTRRGLSADIGRKLLTGFKLQDFPDTRCIDVRDVAEAHILAAVIPEAKGRYILSQAYTTNWKGVGEALEAEFPDQKFAAGEDNKVTKSFDVSKVEKELGLTLRPINKAFVDAVRTTLSQGLVKDRKIV